MLRLPPCRVCKRNASGLHYGVNTCDACKGFFRREMSRKEIVKCPNNGYCDISFSRRNSCPPCRYKKCIAVGMSMDAIRTGRYTHVKRTHDILEINRLKEAKSLQEPAGRGSIFTNLQTKPKSDEEDNERLTSLLLESHNKHLQTAFGATSADMLEKRQQAYYDHYSLKWNMFGPLMPLPKDQYEEFLQITGIDIDNRQDMVTTFAAAMEFDIRRYISFVKSIPTFRMLSSGDQTNLVKNACFEILFFGNYRYYNNKLKIFSTSSGKFLHINEVCALIDKDFMLAVFNFSDSLKSLNLSDEECVLIKAVVFFSTDRCEVQNPKQIESIQWKTVCALLQLLAKTHPKPNIRFAQIIGRLTALRSLTEWNKKIAKSLCKWPAVQERPLLLEMLTL